MRATHAGMVIAMVGLAGCLGEDHPRPAIEEANVHVAWSGATSRYIGVTVPEIPCVGTEDDFLGESGVECTSEPWIVTVDGVALEPQTVRCEAAHQGWFGPVAKWCEGRTLSKVVDPSSNEDVEVVITTGGDEVRYTLHGVRRVYTFTEETPADSTTHQYGIVRVDGIELAGTTFTAYFGSREGDARVDLKTTGRLVLVPPEFIDAGVYQVRVLANTREGDIQIGVPIEGSLTVR